MEPNPVMRARECQAETNAHRCEKEDKDLYQGNEYGNLLWPAKIIHNFCYQNFVHLQACPFTIKMTS